MDLSAVPWGAIAQGGGWVFFAVLVIRGDLISRRVHEEIVTYWRQRYEDQRQTNDEALQSIRMVAGILDKLPPAKERDQ